MHKNTISYFILLIVFYISAVSLCHAQDWALIGEKKVLRKKKVTDIGISNQETAYKKIRFGVKNTALSIRKIIAYTQDGQKYEIGSPSYIKKGEFTAPILFSGKGIKLIKVRLIYRTKRHVIVQLYGIKAAP